MKKFFALTALLVLLTSTSAFALISGSSHDFTASAWTNDICAPCHTPHNAILGAGPLWSHTTSGATFGMYNTTTVQQASPQGVSLACLSCHDGVTNMDDFIGGPATPGTVMTAVGPTLGTDLTNDHPISMTYDETPAGYNAIATVRAAMPLFDLLAASNDQVECATCHDVHAGTAFTSMLRVDPDGSLLCLTCHNK